MKIHAYLLCHNEQYILSHILEYYSSFCSRIFLMDNYSTDDSLKIASEFSKVKVIQWKCDSEKTRTKEHIKHKVYTYKDYSRKGGKYTEEVADWIIGADMDEVIYHPNLLDLLKTFKSNNVTVPKVMGLNVVNSNLKKNTPLVEQCKMGFRSSHFDKRIIWDCEFDMEASDGMHSQGAGYSKMLKQPKYKTDDKILLALLHCKYLGNRWIEIAEKAIETRKHLWCFKDGELFGTGVHYFNQWADANGHLNLLRRGYCSNEEYYRDRITQILDDDLNVLFDAFD